MYSNGSNGINGMDETVKNNETMVSFYLIIIYLFLEFLRPQTLLPILQVFHLPAVTIIFILISILFSGNLYFKDKQTVLFLLLLCEMVIHGPIAVNNYWAYQMFYTMTITFIAYFGIIVFIDSDYKYDRLIKYWSIIYLFVSIIGILNKGVGIGGFIGDENDLAMSLNMVVPFALFGIFSAYKKSAKIYFIILTCLLLSCILTYSRGGFIGLVSVTIYCWIRSNKKIAFATIVGFFVIFAWFTAPDYYWERVATISSEAQDTDSQNSTGAQRVYSWKLGWQIFLQNPVIGGGQGNYPWTIGKAEEEKGILWRTRSLSGRAAHSLYFTLLPELGIVGVLIFITMIVCSLKDLKFIKRTTLNTTHIWSKEESKKVYYLTLALEGSMVGFLTSSVFISTLYYPNFWILCGFIVSLRKIVAAKKNNFNLTHPKYATSN